MPIHTYKCNSCEFQDDFIISSSVKNGGDLPDICPKCDIGKLEKQISFGGSIGIDVPGGYEYVYGKKNWRKNMTKNEQVDVAEGKRNPY